MQRPITAVLLALLTTSTAFAGYWNIECTGQDSTKRDNAQLTFSESSLTGRPQLTFSNTFVELSFSGKQVAFGEAMHANLVKGTNTVQQIKQSVSFWYPNLNSFEPELGTQKYFKSTAQLNIQNGTITESTDYDLDCVATNVVS